MSTSCYVTVHSTALVQHCAKHTGRVLEHEIDRHGTVRHFILFNVIQTFRGDSTGYLLRFLIPFVYLLNINGNWQVSVFRR